ncbi:MAG: hypothetical protein M3Y57_08240 [Acidobacteriota bacterium]|nr:hypothetical protein [Acidobacteriota bacterium]
MPIFRDGIAALSRLSWAVAAGAGVLLTGAIPLKASLNPNRSLASYIHQGWQTAQGLPQNSVLAMAQTHDGYLWIGTEEGLARFDGLRFTVYDTRTAGLRNKTVTALLSGNQNNLWIGTNGGGLSRFRDGVFTAFTTHDGLPSNSILCLYQSRAGTLWIGTDGGGLAAFRDGKFLVYTKANGLSDNVVFSLSENKDGTLWMVRAMVWTRSPEDGSHPRRAIYSGLMMYAQRW